MFGENKDMKTKICSRCKKEKSISEFGSNKPRKDKIHCYCKECANEISGKWSNNNPKKRKESNNKYKKNNSEKLKKYRKENKEKGRKNIKKFRLIFKNKLSNNISNSIRRSLKNGKNNQHWESIVDFTLQEFMNDFEIKFKPGMNWENQGEWHIDHIRPVSSFHFTSYEDKEFKECWALRNLQPLWAKDNWSKNAKYSYIKEV